MAVALMANVLIVRMLSLREEQREDVVLQAWRPVIAESAEGAVEKLPPLQRADLPTVLAEWSRVQEIVRGEATRNLNSLARRLEFDRVALRMVRGHSLRNRLIGIMTLGHLRSATHRDVVLPLLEADDPRISLAAARALVQMDPVGGVSQVVARAGTRPEWPLVRLAMILREAKVDTACKSLLDTVQKSPARALPRLLRLMSGLDCANRWAAIQHAIQFAPDPDVRAVCLSVLEVPEGLEFVRASCIDDAWFVRVQAASALGRIGTADDVGRLIELLSDRVWWVRFRAAQALIELPFISNEELERLSETNEDRFACDALREALAEAKEK